MNNNLLTELNIHSLKIGLSGELLKMSDPKGPGLEKSFEYLMMQPENGGNEIENINNNKILFNNTKEKRNFKIDIIGFTKFNDINSEKDFNFFKDDYKNLAKEFELIKYDSYDRDGTKNIKLKYDKNEEIFYNIKDEQFKNNKILDLDLCKLFQKISNESITKSSSKLTYAKAYNILINDENILKTKFKNIDKEYIKKLIKIIILFTYFLKFKFNNAQKGFPIVNKFIKLKIIEKNHNKIKNKIFFFHCSFNRELDAAIKVKNNYNFNELSGLKELKISENNNTIFQKNDVLLFELKDSLSENNISRCMIDNYDIINEKIKILKRKNEFKNCNFFYIGIQDADSLINHNDKIRSEIKAKNDNGILKIKIYYFKNDIIFNVKFRELDPDKLRIKKLLNEDFLKINSRLNKIENNIKDLKHILIIILIFIILILIIK